MLLITFSKAGHEDIVLTEDDIFDWDFEASCFSSDTFELGGVNAKSLYLLIDNNDRRFSRGAFSNSRATLEINGHVYGEFNVELPKRRNGVIEFTAYDDIIKLDCEYPTDYVFPQLFWSVYAQCLFEAGLTSDLSFDNFVLNALFNNGIISHEYTDYIYANSCRQLISGMAEWNGGFVHFNSDNKLQVDVFSKEITKEIYSSQLLEFDYSDETITFSKVKTSFKNKTYEKGDDSGYTLVIKNQYISYGLTDENFETYLTFIYDYYNGFTLTPMSFTLAEPDHELKIGDRISVYDEEEDVTVIGNISKINITGNCTMTITCGGFGNVSSTSNYSPTSISQNAQTKASAKSEVGTTYGGNVVLIDHAPTVSDLTGKDTAFVQYDPTSTVLEGGISYLYNAVAVFVEKIKALSFSLLEIELLFNNDLNNTGKGSYSVIPSGTVQYVDGISGKCLAATNENQIQITDVSALLSGNFTITMWVNLNEAGIASDNKRRIVTGSFGDVIWGVGIVYTVGTNETHNTIGLTYGDTTAETSSTYNDNTWHKIVITKTTSSITATVDGSETLTITEDFSSLPAGEALDISQSPSYMNGCVDNFRVYSAALTAEEIKTLELTPEIGFAFDGNIENSGYGSYSTTTNGTIEYLSGFSTGYCFNVVNGEIKISGVKSLLDGDFTIVFKFKINNEGFSRRFGFWLRNGAIMSQGVLSMGGTTTNRPCLNMGGGLMGVANSYADNNWHNYVLRKCDDYISLTIDGTDTVTDTSDFSADISGDELYIGDTTAILYGCIDNWKIYNRILTDDEAEATLKL